MPMMNEEKLERYYQLQKLIKKLEEELQQLKQQIHTYFDHEVGQNSKGSKVFGQYVVQRQVRTSIKYHPVLTVERLEELQLEDCIETKKEVNEGKLKAALELGLVQADQLTDCLIQKEALALVVRKV